MIFHHCCSLSLGKILLATPWKNPLFPLPWQKSFRRPCLYGSFLLSPCAAGIIALLHSGASAKPELPLFLFVDCLYSDMRKYNVVVRQSSLHWAASIYL